MWSIVMNHKTGKLLEKLLISIRAAAQLLFRELELKGPTCTNWPHYGKLKGLKGVKETVDIRHCHLQKGKPTYVACWKVYENEFKIEVIYLGTHEKAPY